MTAKTVQRPWDKDLQLLVIGIVAFNLLPHIPLIPWWATAASIVGLIWKALHLTYGIGVPRRLWIGLAGPIAAIAVFFSYGTILGQEAASALLVILASLKVLEANRYRDAMLVIFTSYFLLMAFLLDSQTLLATVYMAADVLLITALMFIINKRDRRTSVRSFRPVMKLLAWALPIWVVLFVAFPRFSTALLNLSNRNQATSGFSDQMNPGSLEKLAMSEDTVMRATFPAGPFPLPETMYWRGAILSLNKGLRWDRAKEDAVTQYEAISERDENGQIRASQRYEVWLEPGFEKWLFVLEYPFRIEGSDRLPNFLIRRTAGNAFEAARNVQTTAVYRGIAFDRPISTALTDEDLQRFLQVPDNLQDDVRALANQLKAAASDKSPLGLSREFSRYLKRMNFRYTLTPPALEASDSVSQLSEFLFTTRQGFCEHFAGSGAVMMRLMGIPARVVVGFQGGLNNEFGNYLIVRKMDAHAWTEIWVANEETAAPNDGTWIRVDPTAIVEPLRLQFSGDYHRLSPDELASGLSSDQLRGRMGGSFSRLASRIAMSWDLVQMRWTGFLLNYDFEYQSKLLALLGLEGITRWVLFIGMILVVIGIGVVIVFTLRRKAHREDPLLTEWRRFCHSLANVGIERAENEGPLAFGYRAAHLRPDRSDDIKNVARLFSQLRYGPPNEETKQLFREFRQSVRRFSIRASSRPSSS